ncbi:MAG: hypothetical protein IKO05_07120 [Selenomonadaceae bacterium]|nr:hypothetical protein [Selenomonadaceae bacterium]
MRYVEMMSAQKKFWTIVNAMSDCPECFCLMENLSSMKSSVELVGEFFFIKNILPDFSSNEKTF